MVVAFLERPRQKSPAPVIQATNATVVPPLPRLWQFLTKSLISPLGPGIARGNSMLPAHLTPLARSFFTLAGLPVCGRDCGKSGTRLAREKFEA